MDLAIALHLFVPVGERAVVHGPTGVARDLAVVKLEVHHRHFLDWIRTTDEFCALQALELLDFTFAIFLHKEVQFFFIECCYGVLLDFWLVYHALHSSCHALRDPDDHFAFCVELLFKFELILSISAGSFSVFVHSHGSPWHTRLD